MVESTLKPAIFSGRGLTSRQEIKVKVTPKTKGHGIVFQLVSQDGQKILVPAKAEYVVNTMRNVVLGAQGLRLCIVEHFLFAAVAYGLDDILVEVDGPEMPLGDGSAKFWLELFDDAGWSPSSGAASVELSKPIVCKKGDRTLMAVPDDSFSVTYLLDWNHPAIGNCWKTWTPAEPVSEIGFARTFGSMQEHQLLGIQDEVVSLTTDGFSQPLRWPDEPVRHKLLDLVGDLALAGINPLKWKARFISIKGGHELDVQMAKELASAICRQER